jgi:hypothetical protein
MDMRTGGFRGVKVALAALVLMQTTTACARTQRRAMEDTSADVAMAQAAVAQKRNVAASDIQVTVLKAAKVPHATVFSARVLSEKGKRGSYAFGVVSGGQVLLDKAQAYALVAKQWGYGAKRTVPAAEVARVFALLESTAEPAEAVLDEARIKSLPPKWRAFLTLPKETVVDGHPAVEFWVLAPEPPVWQTQVIFLPDGSVKLDGKEPPGDLY